jgi:hypothetical protein
MFGFDMPSVLLCPVFFCTPDVVGGVVILPSMSYLVQYHHHYISQLVRRSFSVCWACQSDNGKRAKR